MTLPIIEVAAEPLMPWQNMTRDTGLLLHGALDLSCDGEALAREFAALDADPTVARTAFGSQDGSWTALSVVERRLNREGEPIAALDRLPVLRELLGRIPATLRYAGFSRQAPHSRLDWHFEAQAPALDETRLLLPLEIPEDARTLIGHLAVAYPRGHIWTGDFRFPHKVENPNPVQRVVLLLDVGTSDALRNLLPTAMLAEPERRATLASHGAAWVNHWRNTGRCDFQPGDF